MSLFPFSGYGQDLQDAQQQEKLKEAIESNDCTHDYKEECRTEAFIYYKCSKCKKEKREYND